MGVRLLFGNSRRFDNLEERLTRVERDFKNLELEWTAVYDKVRKHMQRLAKSAAIIEAHQHEEEQPVVEEAGDGRLLTPKQRLIQQQILSRRAAMR